MNSKRGKKRQPAGSSANLPKTTGVHPPNDQFKLPSSIDELVRTAQLDKNDPDDAKLLRRLEVHSYEEVFTGDFVPPALLRALEAAKPGSGQQVLDIVTERSTHRNKLESVRLMQAGQVARRGQFGGVLIALAGVAQFVYVASHTSSAYGILSSLALAIATVGGPAVAKIVASKIPTYDAAKNNKLPTSTKLPKARNN